MGRGLGAAIILVWAFAPALAQDLLLAKNQDDPSTMPADGSDILRVHVVSEKRDRADLLVEYVYGGAEGKAVALAADAAAPMEDMGYFERVRVPAKVGLHAVKFSIRFSTQTWVPPYYHTKTIDVWLIGPRDRSFVLRRYDHERSWCREERRCAEGAARHRGAANGPLAERLMSAEGTVRAEALQEASHLDRDAKHALGDSLAERLIDPDEHARAMALLALEGVTQSNGTVPRKPFGAGLRRFARWAWREVVGAGERGSIGPLVEDMFEADPGRRAFADEELRRIAAAAPPPAADVSAALTAASAGRRDAATARMLVAQLRGDPDHALAAEQALTRFGTEALVVRDQLTALAEKTDGDAAEQAAASRALRVLARTRTAPPEMVPRLRALAKGYWPLARDAVAVLGSLGQAAAAAVPDLAARIPKGRQLSFPMTEAEALADIGPASTAALLRVSRESDPSRRASAVYALARLAGQDARAARRAVEALDEDVTVAALAREGLKASALPRRALARPLFERLLRRDGPAAPFQRRLDMDLAASAWPLALAGVYTSAHGSEIALALAPSTPAVSTRTVYLDLTVTNVSTAPIRLLKPGCSVILGDPVELLVFAEPGWPLWRPPQAAPDRAAIVAKESNSTRLQPHQKATFKCLLQDPEKREKIELSTGGWSYAGPAPAPLEAGTWLFYPLTGNQAPENHLRPGRYHVRARYRLSAAEARKSRFWSEALTRRYGRLWTGEADSNELVLDVL